MYCTQQDLIDRFGNDELVEISDKADSGAINAVVVQQAIDDAVATVNGHLAGRYELPLVNPPHILKKLTCDIARYNLYDEGATEAVEKRNDDAVKFLTKVAEGKVSLGVSQGTEVQGAANSEITSHGHVFSREDNGFI